MAFAVISIMLAAKHQGPEGSLFGFLFNKKIKDIKILYFIKLNIAQLFDIRSIISAAKQQGSEGPLFGFLSNYIINIISATQSTL